MSLETAAEGVLNMFDNDPGLSALDIYHNGSDVFLSTRHGEYLCSIHRDDVIGESRHQMSTKIIIDSLVEHLQNKGVNV